MAQVSNSHNQDTMEQLVLENQVCFALYNATNTMIRAYRPLLEALNLTYPQYLVMLVLWNNNGINVKNLGKQLHLDSGTLTPLLKRLEAKGIIVRKRNKIDERSRDMYLTKDGAALKEKAEKIPESLFCKTGLAKEEAMLLKSICEHTTRNLKSQEIKE